MLEMLSLFYTVSKHLQWNIWEVHGKFLVHSNSYFDTVFY